MEWAYCLTSNKLQGPGKTQNSRIRQICNAAYKGNKTGLFPAYFAKGFVKSTLTTCTYKLIKHTLISQLLCTTTSIDFLLR